MQGHDLRTVRFDNLERKLRGWYVGSRRDWGSGSNMCRGARSWGRRMLSRPARREETPAWLTGERLPRPPRAFSIFGTLYYVSGQKQTSQY